MHAIILSPDCDSYLNNSSTKNLSFAIIYSSAEHTHTKKMSLWYYWYSHYAFSNAVFVVSFLVAVTNCQIYKWSIYLIVFYSIEMYIDLIRVQMLHIMTVHTSSLPFAQSVVCLLGGNLMKGQRSRKSN